MKKHTDRLFRLSSGITFTLALAGGCGFAVDPGNPQGGPLGEVPDLRPDLPVYTPDEDGIKRFHAAQSVLRQSKVRGTANHGNADGVHGCHATQWQPYDGEYSHYEHASDDSADDATQLHVVGVYTSREGLGPGDEPYIPFGPVDVKVNRAGRSVLVLSAYESVTWNVEVADGAELEGIIASGYAEQRVNAPEGIPVVTLSYEEDGKVLGDLGYEWPSYGTTDLVDAAEMYTGLELTSFRGCYASDLFEIDEPGELRPPHEVSPSPDPAIIAGCESLTTESSYCMVGDANAGNVQMVGLDSGATCGEVPMEVSNFGEASLGWMGDYLYMCVRERGLARISIIDGSVDIAPLPCQGVAVQDGGLVVMIMFSEDDFADAPWYVARFASFEDVVERKPEQLYEMAPYASRMAAHGDHLYFAWHAADTIDFVELADGAEFQSIVLDVEEADWIDGMDVTDGGKLVIGRTSEAGGLHIFDVATGAFQGTIAESLGSAWIAGIDCVSGGTPE